MTEPNHEHAIEIVEQRVPVVSSPPSVHPLVAAAMAAKDIDVEKLAKLLAMQSEYEAKEAKKAYSSALADLRRDLPPVLHKDTTVDFRNKEGKRTFYKHTSLASAVDQINEPLARHGFSHSWRPATPDGKVQVTCRLTHSGGHCEEVTLVAPPDTSGSKSSAQAIASTITLLSRYSLLALLGIATADMPEPAGAPGEAAATAPDAAAVVDTDRNLKAAGWLKNQRGVPVAKAEALLGRRVPEWTALDLAAIKNKWGAKPAPAPAPGEIPVATINVGDGSAEGARHVTLDLPPVAAPAPRPSIASADAEPTDAEMLEMERTREAHPEMDDLFDEGARS